MPPVKELTMDQLTGLIGEVVAKQLGNMTKKDFQWGAFPGVPEKDIQAKAWAVKFGMFLKHLARGDVQAAKTTEQEWMTEAQKKSMTEGTDTAGGYLVPEEFRAEILRLVPRFGILRRFARTLPMATDSLRLPRQTGGVSVTWPGEAGAGTVKKPTLGHVLLSAKKAVGLTSFSNELLQDAGLDVISYLQTIFAEAFAEEEDNQLFNGTGVPFVGLLSAKAETNGVLVKDMASGETAFTDITIDHLIDLADQVAPEADVDAWFYFHKNILSTLRKVKVSTTYALAPASQGAPATIAGIPYATSKKLPNNAATAVSTKFAVYGNLRNVLLGDRAGMTIFIGSEGTVGSDNLLEQDMKALRLTERIAVAIAIESAFAVLKTAAS